MRFKRLIGAAVLAASLLPFQTSFAASPAPAPQAGPSPVIDVQADCHSDVRRHFVPELGRRVTHRHRSNCRIVIMEEDDDDDVVSDCHRDVRRHFVPELGRRVTHRHVGPRCRVVVVDQDDDDDVGPRDCHRDVQRHYLPEFGRRVVHRHVGPNCAIRTYEERDSGRNCIKLGPVTYCEG